MNKDKFDAAVETAKQLGCVELSDKPHILYARLELEDQQWLDGGWRYKSFDRPKLAQLERAEVIAWQEGYFYHPEAMAIIRRKREKWERRDHAV